MNVGSPFMVNVGGEPSGRVRETITKDIRDAEVSGPGSKCEFQLKIPGKFLTPVVVKNYYYRS